jgi:molybdopterin/thiamine biosynthesis adenylyltransferase
MPNPNLTSEELTRYARQIGPGVLTVEGQSRLKDATALVTRVGGMGGPASLALVMAGVGRVIVAHGGEMISPDLHRQVLGSEDVIGKPRMPAFADYLRTMNRFVEVEAIDHEPDDAEAKELAKRCDIFLSCPPTFTERLRLNRAAVAAGIPFVDAAQWGLTGTLIVVNPGHTACLECVYPTEPEFEEFFPVVGAISAATGTLAALEAIKILSETGTPLFGKLWMIDGFQGRTSMVDLARNPNCKCCGDSAGESS